MAKRLTDTEKWKDEWYLSLDNDYKIIWQWLIDNCNHAGILKRTIKLLNMMCVTSITEEDLLSKMDGRVIIHNSTWFIPNFLKFQYPTLQSSKPVVLSVVKELIKTGCYDLIPESFGNDYRIIYQSLGNDYKIIKSKDKNKNKNKKEEKEKEHARDFIPQDLPLEPEPQKTTNEMIADTIRPFDAMRPEFKELYTQDIYDRYRWFVKFLTDNENALANILYSDYQVTLIQFKNTLNKFTDEEIIEGVKLLCGKQVKKDDRMVWRINEYIGYYQKNYKKASKQTNTAVYTSNLDEFKDDFKR